MGTQPCNAPLVNQSLGLLVGEAIFQNPDQRLPIS
jgi:hypothetical protein